MFFAPGIDGSQQKKRSDLAFVMFLIAGTLFLIWKAHYGFPSADESFYPTIPYRMIQGDLLFVDEWNMSQISSILLYPVLRLYFLFFSSTEGMFLILRYAYIIVQVAFSICIYLMLRSRSPFAAFFPAIIFLFYTPFNVMALSYNTLALILLIASCLIIALGYKSWLWAMIAGLCFAGAVLCCPFLLLLYLLYSILVFAKKLFLTHKPVLEDRGFAFSYWLLFTAGAVLLVFPLLAPPIIHGKLDAVIAAIPEIINTDAGHKIGSTFDKVTGFLPLVFSASPLTLPVCIGVIALLIVIAFDKDRLKHRCVYIIVALFLTFVYYIHFIFVTRYINSLMPPLCIAGLFAYILSEHREKSIFYFVYIPGLVYSFCIHLASNQVFYNISSALTVSCIASVYYIARLAEDLVKSADLKGFSLQKFTSLVLVLALFSQLFFQSVARAYYTFKDEPTPSLTYTVEYGPAKGIKTQYGLAYSDYYLVYEDTAIVRDADYSKVLYYAPCSWLYLADDARSSAFSAWLTVGCQDMVLRYWELNPDKIPDCIYILKGFGNTKRALEALSFAGMQLSETEYGYIITR